MSYAMKKLRSKKMVSQSELADLIGVSRQTISNYETGLLQMDLKKISEILKALQANEQEVEEFFNDLKQDILSM